MDRSKAANLRNKYHIPTEKDFYQLSSSEVERVLEAADSVKYRKPRNANGSRARYFFAAIQRALSRKE